MDFEGAAMALLEDPESVEAFFDDLTKMHIKMIDNYKKYFHVDDIMFHMTGHPSDLLFFH